MQIIIRMKSNNTRFTLEVEPLDSIKSVKIQIQNKEDIPLEQQQLFFNSVELENSKTVAYYNMRLESILYLTVKQIIHPTHVNLNLVKMNKKIRRITEKNIRKYIDNL